MFQKCDKYIIMFVLLIFIAMLSGCSNPKPEEQSDDTVKVLNEEINTIKSGLTYANQRASEWRETMHLNTITAGFDGKEQIKERKGTITYFFYEKSVKKGFDADAAVTINMKSNSIIKFRSSYGSAKKLGGGTKVLDMEKWTIDINEAFDLSIVELGENFIDQYDNPKIVLRCSESFWDFDVYSNIDARSPDITVKIDSVKGEVLDVIDKR